MSGSLGGDPAATTATTEATEASAPVERRSRHRSDGSASLGDGEDDAGSGNGVVCDGFAFGVDMAPMSTLELLHGGASGKASDCGGGGGGGGGSGGGGGGDGSGDYCDDHDGEPDPPTVLIDSDASPPTAKQRRIARIVMAVAFCLLAMCVIVIGVTLSMSDRVDELDKQRRLAEQAAEKSAKISNQP